MFLEHVLPNYFWGILYNVLHHLSEMNFKEIFTNITSEWFTKNSEPYVVSLVALTSQIRFRVKYLFESSFWQVLETGVRIRPDATMFGCNRFLKSKTTLRNSLTIVCSSTVRMTITTLVFPTVHCSKEAAGSRLPLHFHDRMWRIRPDAAENRWQLVTF